MDFKRLQVVLAEFLVSDHLCNPLDDEQSKALQKTAAQVIGNVERTPILAPVASAEIVKKYPDDFHHVHHAGEGDDQAPVDVVTIIDKPLDISCVSEQICSIKPTKWLHSVDIEQQVLAYFQQTQFIPEQLHYAIKLFLFAGLKQYNSFWLLCGVLAECRVLQKTYHPLSGLLKPAQYYYKKAWQEHQQPMALYRWALLEYRKYHMLVGSPSWYRAIGGIAFAANHGYPIAALTVAKLLLRYPNIKNHQACDPFIVSDLQEAQRQQARQQRRQHQQELLLRNLPGSSALAMTLMPVEQDKRLIKPLEFYLQQAFSVMTPDVQKIKLQGIASQYPASLNELSTIEQYIDIAQKLAKHNVHYISTGKYLAILDPSMELLKYYCYALGATRKLDEPAVQDEFIIAFRYMLFDVSNDLTRLAILKDKELYLIYLNYIFRKALTDRFLAKEFFDVLEMFKENFGSVEEQTSNYEKPEFGEGFLNQYIQKCKRKCFPSGVVKYKKSMIPAVPFSFYINLVKMQVRCGYGYAWFELGDIYLNMYTDIMSSALPINFDAPTAIAYYRNAALEKDIKPSDRNLSCAMLFMLFKWYWLAEKEQFTPKQLVTVPAKGEQAETQYMTYEPITCEFIDAQGKPHVFKERDLQVTSYLQFPRKNTRSEHSFNWAGVAFFNWAFVLYKLDSKTRFEVGETTMNFIDLFVFLVENYIVELMMCLFYGLQARFVQSTDFLYIEKIMLSITTTRPYMLSASPLANAYYQQICAMPDVVAASEQAAPRLQDVGPANEMPIQVLDKTRRSLARHSSYFDITDEMSF